MSKRTPNKQFAQSNKGKISTAGPQAVPDDRPMRGLRLTRKEILAIAFVALLALIVRVILIPAAGHVTDVSTFESWMLTIIKSGPKGFYSGAGFVDYPPGYMLVLWAVGSIYHATFQYADFTYSAARVFVKLPAVICDLGIGYLTYLIARRYWPIAASIVAMAVFVLNPASWLVSAYWGQADSVAAVFLVWALYLAVTERFEFAWLALAFAVLIKPQPLAVAPLLLIWQYKRQGMTWRLALAPLMGLLVAYAGSVWFAPDNNPVRVISWLYDRYHSGIGVYPYNSVNALNLYSINRDFYVPDTQPITFFGVELGPQYAWGMGIFLALTAAVAWRLWRVFDVVADDGTREVTLFTACFTVMLGFFMVLTRQHERYLFTAMALAPLLWNVGPLMRLATVVLSATFSYNLFYALEYLATPVADLHPWIVHPLSFINFATLVLVAGAFLIDEVADWTNARLGGSNLAAAEPAERQRRRGPNPFEGLVGMTTTDYAIAGGLMIVTAVLLFWGITQPKDRYFDEIYYARAAQEYLHGQNLYEWTHPPLTKLIVALGAWFFGKFFGYGDPFGARMANAVMGTLTVPLLYAFAKRLFSSTAGSATAVILLLSSGYFYVQSRIATPEISVAFFGLLTLYCFYRYWTASQITPAPERLEYPQLGAAGGAGAIVLVLIALVAAEVNIYNAQGWSKTIVPYVVAVLAFSAIVAASASGWRRLRTTAKRVVYPDGSYVDGNTVKFPSNETRPLKSAIVNDGGATVTWTSNGVETKEGQNRVVWRANGAIDGFIDGTPVCERQHWGLWLALTAVSLAAFISSKWNGFFGLAGLWIVATAAFGQQFFPALLRGRQPSDAPGRFVWGNPLGIRLPLFFASTLAAILVIYVLTYAPNWSGAISIGTNSIGHAGFAGLLSLQWQMYHYHATLVAQHIYSSKWWTWPLELRPVSYYYQTLTGTTPPNETVAEILSVPNPAVWLAGLISVPWAGYLAWRERHRGVILLIVSYLSLWLPWAHSPRIDFMYNFYPNLAVICLCSTYVLLHIWRPSSNGKASIVPRTISGLYVALCIAFFWYFLPIWDAGHISWTAWIHRMWLPTGAPIGWI